MEPKRLSDWEIMIDGEDCDHYPDFNEWVKALEQDPDYIAKQEKRLDDELGKDRIF